MKNIWLGRIISVVVFGALLAFFLHLDHLRRHGMGKEKYLESQAARYDRSYANSESVEIESIVCFVLMGAFLGAYELLVFGISKIIKIFEGKNGAG